MNQLTKENSLYLKQHANNPVNWYPWNTEALEKARTESKPILLSIGYSACHWCHVMAHESFEDNETAELMNKLFINIKVDREERPDLDKIYQQAQQLLSGRPGGWPLTIFLDPDDHIPFFAGTYFPPVPRYGLPSFKILLQNVADYFNNNRLSIKRDNQQLQITLQQLTDSQLKQANTNINDSPIKKAFQEIEHSYDNQHGGFGHAPKFPLPTKLDFLLSFGIQKKSANLINMLTNTLEKMSEGGIYDQLGGGFFRYSVDEKWEIPHFEKMLYDNAQLLTVYTNASIALQNDNFKTIAQEIAEWGLNDMRSPDGCFYSTLDADTEHKEGKFYYWDNEEIKNLLSPDEYNIFANYFNLNNPPNFESHWHLYIQNNLQTVASQLELTIAEVTNHLKSARNKLLLIRQKRTWPTRDEKILTAWNALYIKGLLLAGYYFNRQDFLDAAYRDIDFIQTNLFRDECLYAIFQNGSTRINGYLDDYAFFLDTLITSLQIQWRAKDLLFAIKLANLLLNNFADIKRGGFFYTSHEHETLIQRPKPLHDEVIPAGNAIASFALARLGHLLGEIPYLETSESAILYAWSSIEEHPSIHTSFLLALDGYLKPPTLVILRGPKQALSTWHQACHKANAFNKLIFAIPTDDHITELPTALSKYTSKDNKVCAYVCKNQSCSKPIFDLQYLMEVIKE